MEYLTVVKFIDDLKGYEKFVDAHRRCDVPINFEINDWGKFTVSAYNIGLSLEADPRDVHYVMGIIADKVNNDLKCGCTFTMC